MDGSLYCVLCCSLFFGMIRYAGIVKELLRLRSCFLMNAEVLAFVLYFLLMLGIGVVFFFKEKGAGEKEYFLGGRHMGPWVTAMSAQASDMSAWLLMCLFAQCTNGDFFK